MENEKTYYVTAANTDKIKKDMDIVFEKIEEIRENLNGIYDVMDLLEPQQKLFFLDNVLMDIILKSQMPVFYINGILTKMKDYLKSTENKDSVPKPTRNNSNYVG